MFLQREWAQVDAFLRAALQSEHLQLRRRIVEADNKQVQLGYEHMRRHAGHKLVSTLAEYAALLRQVPELEHAVLG